MQRVLNLFALAVAVAGCAASPYTTSTELASLTREQIEATKSHPVEATVHAYDFVVPLTVDAASRLLQDRTRACWQLSSDNRVVETDAFTNDVGYGRFSWRIGTRIRAVVTVYPNGPIATRVAVRTVGFEFLPAVIREWLEIGATDCFFTAAQLADDKAKTAQDRSRH